MSSLPPVIILNSASAEGVRGRRRWLCVFNVIGTLTSLGFSTFVYVVSADMGKAVAGFSMVGLCFASVRIWNASLKVLPSSLAVQFFLRAAVVSVLLAIAMESVQLKNFDPDFQSKTWVFPIAFTAGFAEEVAKLAVVLVGLCLTQLPAALALSSGTIFHCVPTSGCIRFWSVLIESPRGLAMAGIAAGLGFMTSENLEYFATPFMFLPTLSCLVFAALRIFLNLHPLLTGLSAARLAHALWHPGGPRSVSPGKVVRAILPSVGIHGMYDFGLMFSQSDPFDKRLDLVMAIVSLLLIPGTAIFLVYTYRRLPLVADRTPLLETL